MSKPLLRIAGNKAIKLAKMIVPEYLQSLETGDKTIEAKDSKITIKNV